jgi:threonine/homoserine/homoserine lactone efflux protein
MELMPDAGALALFVAAAGVLIVIPGPAVFYVLARSVSQGTAAGLVSVLGIGAGAAVHVAAAALGVSAVVMASATAFTVLKWLGAAYLVYLGARTLLAGGAEAVSPPVRGRSLARVFLEAVVVNVLNPKVALFFLAFLPQFVDAGADGVPLQIAFLGAIFVLIGIVSDGVYVLLAAGLAPRVRRGHAGAAAQRWIAGGVYLALGAATALAVGERSAAD